MHLFSEESLSKDPQVRPDKRLDLYCTVRVGSQSTEPWSVMHDRPESRSICIGWLSKLAPS